MQGDLSSAASAAKDRAVAEVAEAIRAGAIERATELARAALGRGAVHPLFLNLRAYSLELEGRPREALVDLERAVTLAPEDAVLHNALGLCLTKFERWVDAVREFEIAVVRQPDFAAAHFNLAAARECAGDLAGARNAYERTLALSPGNPEPLSNLANLAARNGDWIEARTLARKALAADPRQHLALTALANAAIATGDLAGAGSVIAAALADPALPQTHRAMMLTLLGDLRHAEACYGEAFDAYAEANTLRRGIFAERFSATGQETAATYTRFLVEYFDRAPATSWSAAGKHKAADGPDVAAHIILTGFARSGTTLLENILAAHPTVKALDEKEVLADSIREYLSDRKGPDRLARVSEGALAPLRASYWIGVEQYCGDVAGKVFVDKRPMAAMKLPLIVKLFPEAKILFAVRDPRDVILSCYRRQFLLNPSSYEFLELKGAANFYSSMMRLAMLCREKFGLPWLETRNETLIDDFESEVGRIFEFIGLGWSDEVRGFAERAKTRAIATPSSTQVIRGLNREGVGQWRHYRERLAPILPVLEPWIETFGYPPD